MSAEQKTILQIPSDIGEYCRQAATVLESSRRFLDGQIQQYREWAEQDGDTDWAVEFEHTDIERTCNNLAQAVKFLEFLAQHSEHQKPVGAKP